MENAQIDSFVLKVVAVVVKNAWDYATVARCVDVVTRERIEVYLWEDWSVNAFVDACRSRRFVFVKGRYLEAGEDKYPVIDDVIAVRRARRSDVEALA